MLIQVNYTDDRYDYVKDFMLEPLLKSGAITKFRRSSGWVRVGVDPIRKARPDSSYLGAERRAGAGPGAANRPLQRPGASPLA